MNPGFITFEGVEGAGKSTQIRLLADALAATGREVIVTREPGGTPLGRQIRDLLLHAAEPIVARSELLLYAADRAQHMADVVEPAMQAGRIVLCDRHADSLVAYQAFGRGLDRALVDEANRLATAGRIPDLTFVLDCDPAVGLARAGARSALDRLEREDLAFHRRVREGFLALAAAEPARVRVLDATLPEAEIHQAIRGALGPCR